jgi:hypothetical protein
MTTCGSTAAALWRRSAALPQLLHHSMDTTEDLAWSIESAGIDMTYIRGMKRQISSTTFARQIHPAVKIAATTQHQGRC